MSNNNAAEPDDQVLAFAMRLFDYARVGDEALISAIDEGVPVELTNASGDTLLMLSAYYGHAVVVRELIRRGADVDRLNDRGQTPIAGAVFKGHDDVVQELVDAGADVTAGTPSAKDAAAMFGRVIPEARNS